MKLKFSRTLELVLYTIGVLYFYFFFTVAENAVGVPDISSFLEFHKRILAATIKYPGINFLTIFVSFLVILWATILSKYFRGNLPSKKLAGRKWIVIVAMTIVLIKMVFINLLEEILFRGVLLFFKNIDVKLMILLVFIQGFVWGFLHLVNHKDNFTTESIIYRLFGTGVSGILLGGVALASQSIVIPYILHVAINVVSINKVLRKNAQLLPSPS